AITFSGGVGELIYAHEQGRAWPPTAQFGDLGIELAQRIVTSPVLSRSLSRWRPASAGRATVYGLLRHATEVSGSTLYLPRPELLPLTDLPILGSLSPASDEKRIRELIGLAARSPRGACVQVAVGSHDSSVIRDLGSRLAAASESQMRPGQPLVLLIQENVGKTLGNYVTRWGTLPFDL